MWIKNKYKEIMVEPQLNYSALRCVIVCFCYGSFQYIFCQPMQIQHQVIAFQNNGESELETGEMEVTKINFRPRLLGFRVNLLTARVTYRWGRRET